MADKKINYLARSFDDIKEEVLKFSNKYYPEVSDDFNDSSIGAWFVDLVSAVGDDLSYHTDRMFQETNINSANLRSTLLNMARTNGVKIPGAKSSLCEVEVSCELPVKNNQPDWDYAPILQRTSIVSAGNYNYELTEDVNFYEQFNSDGYSNRIFTPVRDSNGSITKYKVAKISDTYTDEVEAIISSRNKSAVDFHNTHGEGIKGILGHAAVHIGQEGVKI